MSQVQNEEEIVIADAGIVFRRLVKEIVPLAVGVSFGCGGAFLGWKLGAEIGEWTGGNAIEVLASIAKGAIIGSVVLGAAATVLGYRLTDAVIGRLQQEVD